MIMVYDYEWVVKMMIMNGQWNDDYVLWEPVAV